MLIVGLGASAGGLEALQQFFGALAELDDAAFLVVQHLDPTSRSLLPELLARVTAMPVSELADGTTIEPGHVYVAPSQGVVQVEDGRLHIRLALEERRGAIDECFTSLAHAYGPRAVGVVLSGSGSDGTLGLQAIHRVGGMTMAQDDASARFEAMPRNAVTSGVVDHALTPAELAREVVAYAEHVRGLGFDDAEQCATRLEEVLPEICRALEQGTTHGLHQYKASTLVRRIQRRMQILRVRDPDAYLLRLREDHDEAQLLLRELLISVTAFFRDPEAFEVLAEQVIRPLCEGRSSDDQIRIWVPGCATGEEAYSIAMLVREACAGLERPRSVQIFATDIDERALAFAREGVYSARAVETVPHERLERFFVRRGMRWQVKPELRELCLFSAHNLVADPPFSRLDLISCRNVLIYLGAPLQQKLISIFHYALRSQGFLFLGPSENIAAHTELFRAVSAKQRLSQRKATPLRAPGLPGRGGYRMAGFPGQAGGERPDLHLIGQRILLDEFAPSYVIVDDQGQILVSSARVERYLEFGEGPFQNSVVRLSRPGLRTALRQALAEAVETRKKVVRPSVPLLATSSPERVTITVQPMPRMGEADDLLMVVFQEGDAWGETRPAQIDASAESVIEQLEHELATTRDDLEHSIQDLESANEELKSSNEELLSMNEELQSANEELESSKEEIQAGNDALARSHADLENLLASSEIATIFLDDSGKVQRFTPPTTAIYNLLPVDLGRPLGDITHNADEMPPLGDELGGPPQEVRTRDGKLFLRRVLPYRTHEGRQEGIVVTFVDVTELRGHQELVQRHAAELEAIYATAPVGLAVVDAELRYRRVNRFLAELNSIGVDEHLGRRPSEIVGEIGKLAEERLQHVLARGEPLENVEVRGVNGQGQPQVRLASYTPVKDASGRVAAVNAVIQDVTVRSRAEDDLRERERMARTLADAAPMLIWMADTTGAFVYVNQRWLEFTGRTLDIEIGNGWMDGVHPEDLERCRAAFASALARRQPFELELRLRRHDGEHRWVLERGAPRFGIDGLFEGYIGGCIDVTDRLHVELELAEAKRVADAANRAKSDFLANMSHEIRTPMTAILGYADVLGERIGEPEARRCIEIIKRNGSYLVQIVNDILDLSKIEAGKLVPELVRFSPGELLVDLQQLLEGRASDRGLTLTVEAIGALPATIEGDPTRLRQILVNLVGNGIKFTTKGGVRVTAELVAGARELRLAVSDTGIGMEPELQARLFEPFSQADTSDRRSYGGTGLGLAISKRLVEALGGRLWVESRPRMGSTFSFAIPTGPLEGVGLVEALPPPAVAVDEAVDERSLHGCRILLVDDRDDVRELMQGFLERVGAKVSHASDGVAALVRYETMAAAHAEPTALVLDMQMPVLDGYETATRLRELGYRGAIVAVTASAMKGDRERCLAAGCDDYLTKPVSRHALVACLARHCARVSQRGADPSAPALRVLVVDDHEDAADSLAMALARDGLETRVAFDGESAVAAAAEMGPDAILLDIGLPGMDGYEVLARLRRLPGLEHAVVIAVSGHGDAEEIERARTAGFDRHVTKPPDLGLLRALLAELASRPRR